MHTGAIKWFDAKKGFGFINDDAGPDVFVHCSAVRYGAKNLNAGDRVEFEISTGPRGPKAAHVRLLSAEVRPPTAAPATNRS